MALIPQQHPREGSLHYMANAVFSSLYMCEKPASLVYQDRKQLQDKPIVAQKT